MGDRANFGMRQDNGDVLFIYLHSGGEGMLKRFANAIAKAKAYGRMTDDAYGSRIIVESVLDGAWSKDLGYGLTVNSLCDNEHKVPVLDFARQTVTLYDMDSGYGFDHSLVTFGVERFIERYAD